MSDPLLAGRNAVYSGLRALINDDSPLTDEICSTLREFLRDFDYLQKKYDAEMDHDPQGEPVLPLYTSLSRCIGRGLDKIYQFEQRQKLLLAPHLKEIREYRQSCARYTRRYDEFSSIFDEAYSHFRECNNYALLQLLVKKKSQIDAIIAQENERHISTGLVEWSLLQREIRIGIREIKRLRKRADNF